MLLRNIVGAKQLRNANQDINVPRNGVEKMIKILMFQEMEWRKCIAYLAAVSVMQDKCKKIAKKM